MKKKILTSSVILPNFFPIYNTFLLPCLLLHHSLKLNDHINHENVMLSNNDKAPYSSRTYKWKIKAVSHELLGY